MSCNVICHDITITCPCHAWVCMCVCMYSPLYMHMCIYRNMHTHMGIMYVCIYIDFHKSVCIQVYISESMYVCMCVYIYEYMLADMQQYVCIKNEFHYNNGISLFPEFHISSIAGSRISASGIPLFLKLQNSVWNYRL